MSISEMSMPIEVRPASMICLDTASSMVTSVILSSLSSFASEVRAPMSCTRRANMNESATIFCSSGKCHEYHSLTRMAQVLTSLSSWSRRQMAWMIMLSWRFTLNLTLAREYEWPRPSCAFSEAPPSRFLTRRWRCNRTPRSSSLTVSFDWQGTPVASLIAEANGATDTPSAAPSLAIDLALGRLALTKATRSSCTRFSETFMMLSSAFSAVVKGWKALSLTILLKRFRSVMEACAPSSRPASSSFSTTSKRP
mmetsp:Transcript_10201/g.25879  ORF Transcript_10201/g.25879 Transcript_10201/m.25879 type:complete len:253 (+) Transcript_10201:635-1393(+)